MRHAGPTQYPFDLKSLNAAPDQPGVFAIFSANKEHLATHFANANLRGALRREASNHPEALDKGWFFVYKMELDPDTRANLLEQWQESPEAILRGS